MPPELRLVCLDIDDTLIDFSAASRRSLAALIGRTDMWPLWERITDEHVARVVAGGLDYADMHVRRTEAFLTELGVIAAHPDIAEFEVQRKDRLRRYLRLFDDVLPCLDWLIAAGVRLAAVTNASGAHQREKLANLGLARFFDHVAIAGEMGVAKPDPVMFHSVCFKLGCDPAEAVHVGDKLGTDAIGARDAGLAGVWLDRDPSGSADIDPPAGIHVLAGLDELPELLVSEFVRVGVPAQR
ncbi:HAD family hydrolase [Prauserella marina]|uniref:Putative hydrolase of the HAD superfamily n=1 Tax=Prauserella marina TaxID=530584 RepID=A0A222VL73_9PSEU|nr:HAD family hydrolase [Prauserella marina]ASR34665.1 HAD family hydrolase [Prauserella marina]PWV85681.1 putative hydrolase of the HAD superfamily [Prauserella marina]SDC48539.1 putative hydrolase of the HAD superfamily [Prauserella marina]